MKTKYLKFGEFTAYFTSYGLFYKYFTIGHVEKLWGILKKKSE
jgi:hypothetical protein